MHIKLASFLRLIVNSCIAEFDLFKFTCLTKISNLFSSDSAIIDSGLSLAMLAVSLVVTVEDLRVLWPLWIETAVLLCSLLKAATGITRDLYLCFSLLYQCCVTLSVLCGYNIMYYLYSGLNS